MIIIMGILIALIVTVVMAIRQPETKHADKTDGTVIYNMNSPTFKLRRLRNVVFISKRKKRLLEEYSWYRTASGKYVHPHCVDYLTHHEIMKLTPTQLEYKLKHGSRSKLPEKLK